VGYHTLNILRAINRRQMYRRVGIGEHPEYLVHEALSDKGDTGKIQYHLKKALKPGYEPLCLGAGHKVMPVVFQQPHQQSEGCPPKGKKSP
jgi:hypothetical protein